MLVITKMQYGKSREQIQKDATNLGGGFVLVGMALFVFAFLLEQYKVPINFLGTTVGYDHPYAGISGTVLPLSMIMGIVGCVVGVAYYYSSIRTTPHFEGPVPSLVQSAVPDQVQQRTIFCRYCGKEIRSDSVFCPECGKNLT